MELQDKENLYSLNKINMKNDKDDFFDDKYKDKIKLLELSNLIDNWEKEILFSENGFFSLKGKDIENKPEEFISELKEFIDSKISDMKFNLPYSFQASNIIKEMKVETISKELKKYEAEQLKQWELEILSGALDCAKNKAVLYKDNIEIIKKCLTNANSVLLLMAKADNWSEKILKQKQKIFISEFYKGIIDDCLAEKNPNCFLYFDKYKKYLIIPDIDKYENKIISLKNNVIAYNWAKELFSYNLSEKENDKEIAGLKDEKLELIVRNILKILKKNKEKSQKKEENIKNDEIWQNIIEISEKEPEKALLYIDGEQKEPAKKAQKDYINKIIKDGYIKSDTEEFIKILNEISDDFVKFKEKNLNDSRNLLSSDDFELLNDIQNLKIQDLYIIKTDIDYIKKKIKALKINQKEDLYNIFKTFYGEQKKLTSDKKINDTDTKNKIIASILSRFSDIDKKNGDNSENKSENKN